MQPRYLRQKEPNGLCCSLQLIASVSTHLRCVERPPMPQMQVTFPVLSLQAFLASELGFQNFHLGIIP